MTFPFAPLRSMILTLAAVPAASSRSQHIPPMDTTSPLTLHPDRGTGCR
ncbi:MAG: hypothetical protein JWM59_3507 [Verrucomicrobiales bacterium]|nr:hypothetical protein [Verrucomicrobiales bacterium]